MTKPTKCSIQVFNTTCSDGARSIRQPIHFSFLDPPFNIGQAYAGHDDKMTAPMFKKMIEVSVIETLIATQGIMVLHGPDDLCELYLQIMERQQSIRSKVKRVAWINWHYRFGQCGRSNWIDARCHALVYSTVGDNYTWNPDAVLVDSDRVSYGDKRVHETENGGKRLPGTMWGVEIDTEQNWGHPSGSETARPIPGFPDYYATWEGGILSRKRSREKFLCQTLDCAGQYLRVALSDSEGSDKYSVHSLVCSAFHGPCPEGLQCRHLDGISTNNCAGNLQWGTPKENANDRVQHGKQHHPVGEKHPQSKLTTEQVQFIRDAVASGKMTQADCAREFSMSRPQVSRIIAGTRWMPGQVFGTKGDIPNFGRVQGNNKERCPDRPNQLPEVYLARFIQAYTNPGDLCFDGFGGTGTTAVVCKALGRSCVTTDIDPAACKVIKARLKRGAVHI